MDTLNEVRNCDLQAVIIVEFDDGRMYPLVEDSCPKCLLPIANRELLSYQIDVLAKSGVDEVYIVAPSDYQASLSSFLHSKEESFRNEGSTFLCDNKDYNRTIKFKKFEEERYIIFDLSRAFAGQFLGEKITPDEEIELSNGKKFKFVSSVYRTSGLGGAHFTSFILLNDIWYYYNDISLIGNIKLKEVGNYNDLLNYNKEQVKKSVMYFYEPMFL